MDQQNPHGVPLYQIEIKSLSERNSPVFNNSECSAVFNTTHKAPQ